MKIRELLYVECFQCLKRLEARWDWGHHQLSQEAQAAGWRTIGGHDYCPACRRSAELSAGVLELAKAGAR